MGGTSNKVDKIDVNGDSRVRRKNAVINGKTYGTVVLTCLCAHDVVLTIESRIFYRRARH